jgi:rare lipoprotein A
MLAIAPIFPHAHAAETTLSGVASWYGPGFHGRTTANGERYDMHGMTAAHKSLAFGTRVRVTNETNGKSVVVRINDRGPYVGKRIIDLSKSAAQAIDMIGPGTAAVTVEVVG